jgi:hypothetical protein
MGTGADTAQEINKLQDEYSEVSKRMNDAKTVQETAGSLEQIATS